MAVNTLTALYTSLRKVFNTLERGDPNTCGGMGVTLAAMGRKRKGKVGVDFFIKTLDSTKRGGWASIPLSVQTGGVRLGASTRRRAKGGKEKGVEETMIHTFFKARWAGVVTVVDGGGGVYCYFVEHLSQDLLGKLVLFALWWGGRTSWWENWAIRSFYGRRD